MASPNTQARDPSFGQYVRPPPQHFATSISNEHSPSFGLNNDIYGPPNDFHAARQFTDFNVLPATHPNTEGLSLESFPNIVEDEDGMFHIEGESGSSRTFHI
jgi:hypothetical protein